MGLKKNGLINTLLGAVVIPAFLLACSLPANLNGGYDDAGGYGDMGGYGGGYDGDDGGYGDEIGGSAP